LSSWAIRIGIIAAIIIGGFVLRDRLSSNAGDLQVGDCFDDPGQVAEVKDVQHHPCSEAHTGEVIYVGSMAGENSAYPSDDTILTFVGTNCLPAFASYTGKEYDGVTLDVGYFHPTSEGWNKGDRGVICYAYNIDGSTTTGSVKVAQ
jgi:hypothetical protein